MSRGFAAVAAAAAADKLPAEAPAERMTVFGDDSGHVGDDD